MFSSRFGRVYTTPRALVLVALLMGACAAESTSPEDPTSTSTPTTTSPPTTTTTTMAAEPTDLVAGKGPLPPGTYTRLGFRPSVTFSVAADGWYVGTLNDGFFDIQQDRGSPDVVAVQFARVLAVAGEGGAMVTPDTAADAVEAIKANPGLVVRGESASRLGGLEGWVVEVENVGDSTSSVMRVAPGTLGFDPGRRLWVALFDTGDGIVAVLVGGSVAEWDRARELAEPILETIVITG